MPVDAQVEFRKLRMGIVKDVLDRRQGAFVRALWYGGQSVPAQALGVFKDVGKDVRVGKVAGLGLAVVAAPIPPVAAVLAAGGAVASFASAFAEKGVEAAADGASGFLQKWKMKTGGTTELGADEKNIKDIGETIERNIVKLTDAKKRATAAVNKLNQSVAQPANAMNLEAMAKSADDAMRTVYEVGHYQAKLTTLAGKLAGAVDKLRKDLAKLDDPLTSQIDGVEQTAEAVLKACLASKQ